MISCVFCEIFKNNFFCRTPLMATSEESSSYCFILDNDCNESLGLDASLPERKRLPDDRIKASTERLNGLAKFGRLNLRL